MKRTIDRISIAAAAAIMALMVMCAVMAEGTYASDWSSFRGNDLNNGLVSCGTPTDQKLTEPVWIKKFGSSASGMSSWDEAPTVPIIVDDDIITTSGKTIMRLSSDNGAVKDSGKMSYAADWGYTSPTYFMDRDDRVGYVFCPLSNGTIDVFDVDDLSKGPLWSFNAAEKDEQGNSKWGLTPEMTMEEYKEAHKGEEPPAELVTEDGNVLAKNSYHQSVSPVVYSDGIIYTGFFTYPYTYYDYYVAIATRDMTITDPSTGIEKQYHRGDLIWKYKSKGGFYWDGAVVIGDTIIVGTQDGEANNDVTGDSGVRAGDSYIIAFNKKTGQIISKEKLEEAGDICSSIVYDIHDEKDHKSGTGRIFWSACGGFIYSADVDPVTGEISDVKRGALGRKALNPLTVSTPVVYKSRVYLGFREKGVKGYFAAFDAVSLADIYKAELDKYSKSSPLITNAYEASTGYLYAYMASYDLPGDVTVIKFKNDVKPEQAKDENYVKVSQLFAANGYSEYGACSLIADEYGQLYYKNDSQSIFAIGKCDEMKLGKVSGFKLTASSGKYTIKFNKVKNATRYRIVYRINETGSYKYKYTTKTSYTIKKKSPSVITVKVRPEHIDAAKKVYGTYNTPVTKFYATSKISKLTGGKACFTVKFNKVKIADGYEIQYSSAKSMKYAPKATKTGASKVQYKISNLVGGKTYYVRVRAYKIVNQTKSNGKWVGGTKQYGKWSSKKKVKVKAGATALQSSSSIFRTTAQ